MIHRFFTQAKPSFTVLPQNVIAFWDLFVERGYDGRKKRVRYCPPIATMDRVVAFVLLIAVCFFAIDPLITREIRMLPAGAREFFDFVTFFGEAYWYITPAVILLLLIMLCHSADLPKRIAVAHYHLAAISVAIITAIGGGGLFINLVKRMIGRARPKHLEELGPYAFDPFAFKSSFAAFPSGHSTTAGTMFIIGIMLFPRWKWSIGVFALSIGISRIVLGSHYPADVMAGLACGMFFGWLVIVYFCRRGLGFQIDSLNRIGLRKILRSKRP